ncbi:MAG: hypothetical protein PWR32_573 [Candidatus Woesearchaeota archaeon]|nr:hypothetical protein [Candidatus Woesearchaeota archaeon]
MKKLEIIILTLAVLTIISNSLIQTLIINNYSQISGFATLENDTDSGKVSFCIPIWSTENLTQNFSLAGFSGVLTGSVPVSTEVTNYIPGEIAGQKFTLYNREGTVIDTISGSPETEKKFSATLDTLNYPDKNCYYRLVSEVFSYRNSCLASYINSSGFFSINNVNAPPVWNQFKNENSTNLDAFSDWTNLSNVVMFKPGVGSIKFTDNTNFEQADLDSKIIFLDKYLKMDEEDFYCLAYAPKEVTFFNVSYILPAIQYNGIDCSEAVGIRCNILEYNKTAKTLKVEIDHPGEYVVKEGLNGDIKLNVYNLIDNQESDEVYYAQTPIFFKVNHSLPINFDDFENINCSITVTDEKNQVLLDSEMKLNNTYPGENLSSAIYLANISEVLPIATYHTKTVCKPKPGSGYYWDPKTHYQDFKVLGIRTDSAYWSDTKPILLFDLTREENTAILDEDAKKYSINPSSEDNNAKVLYNSNTSAVYIRINRNILENDSPLTQSNVIRYYVCNISWGDGTSEIKELNKSLQELNILETNNGSIVKVHKINISILTHKYKWPGDYDTFIHCYDPNGIYWDFYDQKEILITNRKPVQAYQIPDVTWYMDTAYTPFRLNDYFYDPDGENLTYSALEVRQIAIYISNDSSVTLIPEKGFIGSRLTFFTAIDPHDAAINSNLVNLTVVGEEKYEYKDTEEEESLPGEPPLAPQCQEMWNCSEWGKCMPSGIQVRKCYDLNQCNTTFHKPIEWRTCVYTPTCDDGLKNQNETGVDCGGPCPPCPSCNNGIKDWNEEGIDCGGFCPPCPSCYDGIQNQGEEGIDCGGPCPPCREKQTPGVIQTIIVNHLNEIIIAAALLTVFISFVSILFKKVSIVNQLIVKLVNRIISALSIPSFTEHNIYSELILKINQLERFAARGKLSTVFERADVIFNELIKNFLLLEKEKSYDELLEIIPKLHLNELDKLLLQYLTIEFEKVKFGGQTQLSRKKLINLIKKMKILVERNRHLLLEIQLNKEIEGLQKDIKSSSASELLEKRILLNLLRELLLIHEKIEQKKIKDALRIYKNIKKLYSKLNFWNRLKVYNRVALEVSRLKKLINELKTRKLDYKTEIKNQENEKTKEKFKLKGLLNWFVLNFKFLRKKK